MIGSIRTRRQRRVRAKFTGSHDRPRLSVHISARHITAQLIDDSASATVAMVSTVSKKDLAKKNMSEKASWVGEQIAKLAKEKKITTVVFDRGARQYHGRVAKLAEAARAQGLKF